mmetsp:Transcript_30107/g.65952  ORF Transcript_30107/g.65952 Transcript_30107/m.65952 type:complete len:323 (+) Transcript_30107:222-1190(+)
MRKCARAQKPAVSLDSKRRGSQAQTARSSPALVLTPPVLVAAGTLVALVAVVALIALARAPARSLAPALALALVAPLLLLARLALRLRAVTVIARRLDARAALPLPLPLPVLLLLFVVALLVALGALLLLLGLLGGARLALLLGGRLELVAIRVPHGLALALVADRLEGRVGAQHLAHARPLAVRRAAERHVLHRLEQLAEALLRLGAPLLGLVLALTLALDETRVRCGDGLGAHLRKTDRLLLVIALLLLLTLLIQRGRDLLHLPLQRLTILEQHAQLVAHLRELVRVGVERRLRNLLPRLEPQILLVARTQRVRKLVNRA